MSQDLVFGLHAVEAVLRGKGSASEIWVDAARDDARMRRIVEMARESNIVVHRVDHRQLDRLAGGVRTQGVAARCAARPSGGEADLYGLVEGLDGPALLLVLDGVEDPHNLGACLRSAEAAGAHGVVIPGARAAGLTAVARRVACGAAERVPFFEVANLARVLRRLQELGVWIVGADAGGDRVLWDADLSLSVALVLGGEGKGVRRLTREHCDWLVRIPMAGEAESLNVSVAAALCLYEARRQRA